MARPRKETREEAIARADRAESRTRAHVWALGYLQRSPDAIQWFDRPEWRLGLCPEQPRSGVRVVIVFERDTGRIYPDGSYHGAWRVEFLDDLQAWRRSTDTWLRDPHVADGTRALADLLDAIAIAVAQNGAA